MVKNFFKLMGVINLTPDSFSDGGVSNSPQAVYDHATKLLKQGVSCLDFGAESTAPFNQMISATLELDRFEKLFFPILPDLITYAKQQQLPLSFSIDTYKGEVFERVYEVIKQYSSCTPVIWNDVSGCRDEVLAAVLAKCSDCHYIACHSLVPSRDESSHHMKYLLKAPLSQVNLKICDSYQRWREWFELRGWRDRWSFDPCFGFSKNIEQNLFLLGKIPAMIDLCLENTWVLGISRKSFLRYLSLPDESIAGREFWHALILGQWQKQIKRPVVIRLHDPAVWQLALKIS